MKKQREDADARETMWVFFLCFLSCLLSSLASSLSVAVRARGLGLEVSGCR